METFNLKSINDRLIQNVVNFGDAGSSKQTSLQYNIWKQSIDQRQQDEMNFITLMGFILILISVYINSFENSKVSKELEIFGMPLAYNKDILAIVPITQLSEYCGMIYSDSSDIYSSF